LEQGISLHEAAKADRTLAKFWAKFSTKEKQLIENPEEYYSGLAEQKALAIYDNWK
jgi:hypothetical protein